MVATDYFAWKGRGWDTGQGKAGFELAREALHSHVEDVEIDVIDLSPETVGVFDVVLFLGVLYHVKEPLAALERVASVTRDLLVVETVIDMVGIRRPAVAFYPADELSRDPTNWWGPNLPALHGMLRAVGFQQIETVTKTPSTPWRILRRPLIISAAEIAFSSRYGRIAPSSTPTSDSGVTAAGASAPDRHPRESRRG